MSVSTSTGANAKAIAVLINVAWDACLKGIRQKPTSARYEDVALPEVEVHCPDQKQHEQPALEQDEAAVAAPLCSGKLQRKPEAEEQRKERIELAVAEPIVNPATGKSRAAVARPPSFPDS